MSNNQGLTKNAEGRDLTQWTPKRTANRRRLVDDDTEGIQAGQSPTNALVNHDYSNQVHVSKPLVQIREQLPNLFKYNTDQMNITLKLVGLNENFDKSQIYTISGSANGLLQSMFNNKSGVPNATLMLSVDMETFGIIRAMEVTLQTYMNKLALHYYQKLKRTEPFEFKSISNLNNFGGVDLKLNVPHHTPDKSIVYLNGVRIPTEDVLIRQGGSAPRRDCKIGIRFKEPWLMPPQNKDDRKKFLMGLGYQVVKVSFEDIKHADTMETAEDLHDGMVVLDADDIVL